MAPPRLLDLLVGPLRGLSIFAAAPRASVLRTVAASFLVIFALALLLGMLQLHRLGRKIDAMESSALALMPRVALSGGRAHVEGSPGRVIETDRVVVLFDTRPEAPDIPRAYGADQRPRVVVRADALLLFTAERSAPLALPFSKVHAAVGDVTVDGPGLVRALRHFVPRMVATLGFLAVVAALLWQLVLAALLVTSYRLVLHRGVTLPPFGDLYVISLLAGTPALLAGAGVLAVSGRQDLAVTTHAVVAGGLFLLGAMQLRAVGGPPSEGAVRAAPPSRESTRVVTEL